MNVLLRKILYTIQPYLPFTLRRKLTRRMDKNVVHEEDYIYSFLVKELNINNGFMVDVGAAYGEILEPFARKGWKVLAFEPDLKNGKVLDDLISSTKINVEKCPLAVSDTEGVLPFYDSDVSAGIKGLNKFHSSHVSHREVQVTTLKKEFAKREISKVDFLKIDTEGFDLMVLKGIDYKSVDISVIMCEYENAKTKNLGYSVSDMARHLKENGYNVIFSEWHPLVEYGSNHKWKQFTTDETQLTENGWGNILAVKNALYNDFKKAVKL